jgi:uncharacterized membrane protein YfcA
MHLPPLETLIIAAAALVAGLINALAGGGTLISFPVLTALGVPAVAANVTNSVALTPGFLGGIVAQRRDLRGQASRMWVAVPASAAGGIVGGVLLLWSDERVFLELVPWLILLASGLIAAQEPLRRWLLGRATRPADRTHERRIALPLAVASIYGGYFGAGLSVVVLAGLGLVLTDTLTRLNALKQVVAFSINIAAGVFFLFSGQVVWPIALIMAAGALAGGALGGGLATRINPTILRRLVVGLGVVVGGIYLIV